MKAIILAAGRGSRMKELTSENPKCLLKLNNKSLLELQLKSIKEAGVNQIAIVTGYKNSTFKGFNIKEIHNKNWSSSQMFYSLLTASSWLKGDSFIVSYSDIFYKSSAIKILLENKHDIAITYDPNWKDLWTKRFVDPLSDAESFKIDEESFLIEIGNKEKNIEKIMGQYMGLLKFSSKGWDYVLQIMNGLSESQKLKMDMTSLLKLILRKENMKILALPYLDIWGEVDHKSDLDFYQRNFDLNLL